jgi:hypothetical protein
VASHAARPPLGLFDNPVRVFSLDELAETVRRLERERPGRTVEELSGAVFTELAIKRTQRAADLVAEAIRLARPRRPGTEITGSQWQASTSEVRNWALSASGLRRSVVEGFRSSRSDRHRRGNVPRVRQQQRLTSPVQLREGPCPLRLLHAQSPTTSS